MSTHAGIYWHLLQYIPICVLCSVYLACFMVCIVVCIESIFAHIIMQYKRNTNRIRANTDMYLLNTYLLARVLNTCWYVFNAYHQYTPQYTPQYMPIHSTHWHILSCNTCQYLHVAITDVTRAIIKLISRTSTCVLVLTPSQYQRNSDGSVTIQDSVSARLPLSDWQVLKKRRL